MKLEWKKEYKDFYLPKSEPSLIEIPTFKFFCIEGIGNPNKEAFAEKVQILYSLSYAIKMSYKKDYIIENYFDYSIFPLEGLWCLDNPNLENKGNLDKNNLKYKIMIRQPNFVGEKDFEYAKKISLKKKISEELLKASTFEEINDGLSVQCIHIGSYDDEPTTFDKMNDFIDKNALIKKTTLHREIYLSDPRNSVPEKTKTVLRYFVDRK